MFALIVEVPDTDSALLLPVKKTVSLLLLPNMALPPILSP